MAGTESAQAALGDLTQKPGLAGCLSETGAGPCTDATGLQGAFSLALGPGDAHAYVAGLGSSALGATMTSSCSPRMRDAEQA